ncbi:Protein FAR1-RELATED SEQUENCE 5 [Bienertia sinuspersici]
MVFLTLDDLDNLFRRYAKQQGFGIVKAGGAYKQEKGKTLNERRNCTWKCESGGKPDGRVRASSRLLNGVSGMGVKMANRKTKKVGCPVMLHAKVTKDGKWQIRNVVLQHQNHEPVPSISKYISMFHREDLNAVRRRFFQHHDEGVSIPQIHSALAAERNGVENFPVSERQLRNVVDKEKRLKMMEGEANAMAAYFHRMSTDNQNFFHLHRLDDDERLKDVMWVDACSRAAYIEFGDVVCFDSTYLTNRYLLPFANFVGVNHHGQSVLLGCALISHEDAETFEWVFSNWISCMGGKAPSGILTDQDAAMKKAIAKVMPNTRHRWCLWHILNKLPLKLGGYDKYHEIKQALLHAIYDSYTVEEFENSWNEAIDGYNLGENAWLKGMRSTQRVESMNSFFDKYLKKQTRLYEFVQQYCKAMERRAEDEKQADADSVRFCHQLVSDFPIERVFQKIYTSAKFVEVQQECLKNLYVSIVGCKVVDENVLEYTIEDRVWVRDPNTRKDVPTHRKREYEVKYNSNSYEAWCVCKLMESSGIICRHIIAVFEKNDVEEMIPESSIPPPLTRTTHSTFVLLGNDWTTPLSSAESSKDEFDSWKELPELRIFDTRRMARTTLKKCKNTRCVNIQVNGVVLLMKVNDNAVDDGVGVVDKLVTVVIVVAVLGKDVMEILYEDVMQQIILSPESQWEDSLKIMKMMTDTGGIAPAHLPNLIDLNVQVFQVQAEISSIRLVVIRDRLNEDPACRYHLVQLTPEARSSETLKIGMSIIVWNARGVCRPSFIYNFRRLFAMHNPTLVLITETRCSHVNFEDVFARIATPELDSKVDESVGLMSGVVLMWNKCMAKVDATTPDQGVGPGES